MSDVQLPSNSVVVEVNGEPLMNPTPQEVARVIARQKCDDVFEANKERVAHFSRRIDERGLTGADVVIVVLVVDDTYGGLLADTLMPGQDWQAVRDRGEIPIARGLAVREGIEEAIGTFDPIAAAKMRSNPSAKLAVVVGAGIAEVYQAD